MKARRSACRKSPEYDRLTTTTSPRRSKTKYKRLIHSLETLPSIVLSAICSYASGLNDMDSYLQCHLRHSHQRNFSILYLFKSLRELCPAMVHTRQSWRHLLLPDFYRTAAYNGRSNILLVPDEHVHYMRRIVMHIPDNYKSFRSMTRTMYHLPEDVRARISWFGLCMGSDTALSTSEYGALSGAFPNALNLSVELGNIVIKEKSIYRALVDPQVPARITTLTIRLSAMTSQSMGFRLVQRTARSLEYLDLGRVCLVAVCMLLWPEKHTQENDHVEHLPVFPNLAHLRFTLVDTVRVDPEWNPRWCEFPRLERMCFSVTSEDSQGIRGMSSPMDPVARQWLAVRLLMYPLPRLKHLELDCVDEAVIFEAHPCLPGLVHLHLIQHTHLAFGPESNATEPSLSRILNSALSIDSLKVYRNWSSFRARCMPLQLASSIHGLRELNIATWSISLCDLQLLLAKLPELEGIHATLTDAHMHPQPESIAYNVTMKRMWLDTAFGDVSKWVRGPVDSLLAFISHMMNLEELLLFTKAFQRLGLAISCKSNEDLIRLARTANIGQCHRDENQIKSQTAGPIR